MLIVYSLTRQHQHIDIRNKTEANTRVVPYIKNIDYYFDFYSSSKLSRSR